MYAGLFGDLPATKTSKGGEGTTSVAEKKEEPKGKTAEKDVVHDYTNKNQHVEEPKKVPSLIQSLGVVGTSMAFIPTHLKRKRNLVKKTSSLPQTKSAATGSSSPAKVVAVSQQTSSSAKTTKFAVLSDATVPDKKFSVPSLHTSNNDQVPVHRSTTAADTIHTNLIGPTASEPEELRLLHESVTDPYDPLVPNDLLQYWERQAAVQERQEIEREARETFKQQQHLQQQLEFERKELEKTGDIDRIVEHRQRNTLPARGRGRGISNLPAWLVEKQKLESGLSWEKQRNL